MRLADDNIDKAVAVFGDGSEFQKLAEKWCQPVTYVPPSEVADLLKLADAGDELATLLVGIDSQCSDASEGSYKLSLAAATSCVVELVGECDKRSAESQTAGREYSKLVDNLGVVSQIWPGQIAGVPNRPGPLASMLVLGSLGALSGNLAGRLIGRSPLVDRKRSIRNSTLIGGAIGALPGVAYAGLNLAAGEKPLAGRSLSLPYLPGVKVSYVDPLMFSRPDLIPVERMQQMIWEDPRVAGRLPVSVAAATSALVEGASRQRPREFPFVTPTEIARMAMGMGAGYTSGMLAGKALGALFGVSDQSQQVLRNTGAAAGIIKTFVPMAFGR